MWILPSNHPLYSAYAPEAVASKKDLQTLLDANQQLPLMWRSKPLSLKIWLQKWKKVFWLQHLFSRILKPSMASRFVTEYTASLAVIRAKEKATQGKENSGTTPDSFGRILNSLSSQLSLFSVSSKTSQDTLQALSSTFLQAYENWVTQLRQEYTQRAKLSALREKQSVSMMVANLNTWLSGASHSNANGSLSSQSNWATPNCMDSLPSRSPEAMKRLHANGNRKNRKQPSNLREQIDANMQKAVKDANAKTGQMRNWPTATVSDTRTQNLKSTQQTEGSMHSVSLPQAIEKNWSTPRVGGQENYQTRLARGKDMGLPGEVQFLAENRNWPTPAASEVRQGFQNRNNGKKGKQESLSTVVRHKDSRSPVQATPNTLGSTPEATLPRPEILSVSVASYKSILRAYRNGKRKHLPIMTLPEVYQLNPFWVAQLMGTTLEKTFYACSVMPLCAKQPKKPTAICTTNSSIPEP